MTQLMLIKRNHPIRDEIRGLASGKNGGQYYEQISHWYDKVKEALTKHSLHTHCKTTPFVYNNQGGLVFNLEVEDDQGRLLDSGSFIIARYYRMPSGNWEITCRVS